GHHGRLSDGRQVASLGASARSHAAHAGGTLQAPRRGGRRIFVDTHLHLEELGDTAEVVRLAAAAGVTRMVAMGVNLEHSRRAVEMASAHDAVWAGVGHYPTEESAPDLEALRALARDQRVVAIGEVGLDYEHGDISRHDQWSRFEKLCGLAVELDLPVSIHNRGATDEIEKCIHEHPGLHGAMHYFALGWD